jgi:WD40 repeat protein
MSVDFVSLTDHRSYGDHALKGKISCRHRAVSGFNAHQQQHHKPISATCCLLQVQVSQLDIHAVEALTEPGKAVAAACPTADHLLAYVANSFVVIHDTSTNKQVRQLRSTTSNQPLQCVAWSCCGTHLAAGEMGSHAAILIWDHSSGKCVHELRGHKATVGKLCFSPDGKYLGWQTTLLGCLL